MEGRRNIRDLGWEADGMAHAQLRRWAAGLHILAPPLAGCASLYRALALPSLNFFQFVNGNSAGT